MQQQKKFGSYPNLMVVISLTIALFLVGLCGLMSIQARKLSKLVKENIEVQIYLAKDLSSGRLDSIYKTLITKPFVAKKDGQFSQINFVSKEVAAKRFIKETKEEFKEFLGENPLRDAYILKIDESYFEETKLVAIKKELEQISGVFEVGYLENFVDQINKNISSIYLGLSAIVIILIGVILLLINNTIKLAFYSQRMLIRSMKLVGATDNFIRKPFLTRSIFQGTIAALIAAGMILLLQQVALLNIPELVYLQEIDKMIYLAIGLIILGLSISLVSTYYALGKYINMSLDDLY